MDKALMLTLIFEDLMCGDYHQSLNCRCHLRLHTRKNAPEQFSEVGFPFVSIGWQPFFAGLRMWRSVKRSLM